jgi:hypothetical protein
MRGKFEIRWIGRGGPPRQPPNPGFPDGKDVDLTVSALPSCSTPLPYPTGRDNIGGWMVRCQTCGVTAYVTAASRPDDPRSLKIHCKLGATDARDPD